MDIDINSNYSTLQTILWNSAKEDFGFVQNVTDYVMENSTNASNKSNRKKIMAMFYPVIVLEMILSIICFIFSIKVYCILPEFRNVHGKNLISLSSCLLSTFLLLILDIILRKYISYSFCFIIAMAIHITFLATFFWTNVMAFDIWRTITSMKPKNEVKHQSKKYLKYSLYAWIATILTTLPAVILELTTLVPLDYRPQFGVSRCWLSGTTAFIYYFNLPVGVILLGNLIMFFLTVRNLRIIKKMTAILHDKKQEQRLHLYLKLFLVMGIIWFSEFLPWVTDVYELYALAGMLTALYGVLLFAIFVMKRRILRQVWEKLKLGKLPNSLKDSSTSQPTLSSSGQQFSSQNICNTVA